MHTNHVLSVHWRLIIFAAAVVIVFIALFNLKTVLFPFFLGLLLAYIFRPIVVFLEKRIPVTPKMERLRRVIIIIVIFMFSLAVLAIVTAFFISTVVNSGQQLLDNATNIVRSATNTLREWLDSIRLGMPDSIKTNIDNFLNSGGTSFSGVIQTAVDKTISFVPSAAGFFLSLAVLPVFLFYLMLDWDKLSALLAKGNSPGKMYLKDTIAIAGRVVGRYFRGQLILGAIVGTIVFVGTTLIGFSPGIAMALGFLSFVMEMIPIFGPWVTLVIGIIVTLAFMPQKLLWVIGLHAAIPILEGNFLVPRIQGKALNIHPALGLFVLVLGTNLAGVWGMVLAFPFTAMVIALYQYFIMSVSREDHKEAASQAEPVPP